MGAGMAAWQHCCMAGRLSIVSEVLPVPSALHAPKLHHWADMLRHCWLKGTSVSSAASPDSGEQVPAADEMCLACCRGGAA